MMEKILRYSKGDALTNQDYNKVDIDIINEAMNVFEFHGGAMVNEIDNEVILKSFKPDELSEINVNTENIELIDRKWGRREEKNRFPDDPEYTAVHSVALHDLKTKSKSKPKNIDILRHKYIETMEPYNITAAKKHYRITDKQTAIEVEDHRKSFYSIIHSIRDNCFPLPIDVYKVFKAIGIPPEEYQIAAVQLYRLIESGTLQECKKITEQQFLILLQTVKELLERPSNFHPKDLETFSHIQRGRCMHIKEHPTH